MRTVRTLLALALAMGLMSGAGCTTIYYQNQRAPMFHMSTSGKDFTLSSEETKKGVGHAIQPWVLAYVLAHPSTNLPYYYERVGSWGGNPPMHFVVQTDPLLTEYSDRRDSVAALARSGALDRLFTDAEKKDKAKIYARCCAASVGIDTWLGACEAIQEKGYAGYGWGNKPEMGSDKMNIAAYSFHVSIDPDAQLVTVTTTKRDLALGAALMRKTCVFDVSKVKWTVGGKEGGKKIGAFDFVDHDGNDLATEKTWDEIGDWPKSEVPQRLRGFLGNCEVIPPEVVAKGIQYLGTPESVEE